MARLPKVNFQPVVNPYVALPTQELGLATQVLRKDYEDALAQTNQARQALGTVQAYDPRDQQMLDAANEELLNTINAVQESGDYERQKSLISREFGKYQGLVQPIMQKNQQINELRDYALKVGADPNRVVNAALSQDNSIVQDNGIYYNRFRPQDYEKFIAPPVNITQELSKYKNLFNKHISSTDPTETVESISLGNDGTTYILRTNKGQVEEIPISEVNDVLDAAMQDESIQRYINAEKELTKAEKYQEYLSQDYSPEEAEQLAEIDAKQRGRDIISQSKDPIAKAISYRNQLEDESTRILGTIEDETDINPEESGSGIGVKRQGTSVNVSDNISNMSDLNSSIETIDKAIQDRNTSPEEKVILGIKKQRLEKTKSYINNQLPEIFKDSSFTQDEQDLLLKFGDQSDEEITNDIQGYRDILEQPNLEQSQYNYYTNLISEKSKLRDLRNRLSSEQSKKVKELFNINSITPEIKQLGFSKNKDSNMTTREELKNYISDDIESYNIILQDGRTLEEAMQEMSEEEKERIEDISESKGTMESIFGELSIDGYTSVPVGGNVAITGKLSTKYNELFGTDVYIVPKLGNDSGLYSEIANETGDSVMKGLSKLGSAANFTEKYFQELILTNPKIIDEPDTLEFSKTLPKVNYTSTTDGRIAYKIISPDGQTSSLKKGNFIDIRNDYYKVINALY